MSVLNDKTRYQLLKLLEQNPNLTQRQLAKSMGISLGKANFCLKALIERGWVKVGNFRKSENKKNYAYYLTPKGFEEKTLVTLRFLKRKQQEHDELVKELEGLHEEVEILARSQDKGVD